MKGKQGQAIKAKWKTFSKCYQMHFILDLLFVMLFSGAVPLFIAVIIHCPHTIAVKRTIIWDNNEILKSVLDNI